MSRQFFLDLAARGHRVPIATDLVLREHADAERILTDGARLGAVVAQAAREFHTPLALPIMDLRLEKAALLADFDIPAAAVDTFHFAAPPPPDRRQSYARHLQEKTPGSRAAANLGALRHIATQTDLLPIAMCIGPFSLTSKLLDDPITPVFLAGSGATAEDEPDVALLEACLEVSLACVRQHVRWALAAGAKAVFIAEPAANQVYFSPRQLAAGSDVFERFALRPNREIAEVIASHGADLIFHCCGELVDAMVDGFCSLRPAMLSLGSSRRLGEDAARVPQDIVLYGNLPSKMFYSDELMPESRVGELAENLAAQMAASGHPFILGTECDTLHVAASAATIRAKVRRLARPA